jgi:hypothetical protein
MIHFPYTNPKKPSNERQGKTARYQLPEDVQNELKWQETLANPDIDISVLQGMANAALLEDEEGETEEKGFGEE